MQFSLKNPSGLIVVALMLSLFICRQGMAQEVNNSETGTQDTVQEAKLFQVPLTPPTNPPANTSTITSTQQTDNLPSPVTPPSSTTDRTNLPTYDMTAGEKLAYGARRAFLSPTTLAFPAYSAYNQVKDEDEDIPGKDRGDKVADGLSRYARNFGTAATKNLFAFGVYPIVFKQDPRYAPSPKSGFKNRVLYASTRVFITKGDNGTTQINYSQLSGNMTAASLANIWERSSPSQDRIGVGPTFRRFRNGILLDVVRFIVFKEFGPDIKKLILRR